MVFGDNPDDEPSKAFQKLHSPNIFEVLVSVNSMVVAVIFHGHHEIWPAHVEVSDRKTVRVEHRNLGVRPRQTSLDEKQPQIALPR